MKLHIQKIDLRERLDISDITPKKRRSHMSQKIILATAALAAAASTLAAAVAAEYGDGVTGDTGEIQAAEPAKRRGRPPADSAHAEKPAPAGKTIEELRDAIKPLVEEGRGDEVKKVIAKHGGTKIADIPAANHAAFLKDIDGLSM